MNSRKTILAMVPVMVLEIGLATQAFAQATAASAPSSAGTSMSHAGENTEAAARKAYLETVTALDDTLITTKVKAAFASGKDIDSGDIHVTTTAGIVTLDGSVENLDIAARAGTIASNTEGVRGVTNDLRVSSPASQD